MSKKRISPNIVRCIVTGQEIEEHQALRFVLSPNHDVVPDVFYKLPGNACYTCFSRIIVAQAVKGKYFEDFWKQPVHIPDGLENNIEKLLLTQCLNMLSLAKRSGAVVTGFDKVYQKVLSERARLLFCAADASDDGKSRVKIKAGNVRMIELFDRLNLSDALGKENVVYLAVTHIKWKEILEKVCDRYHTFLK